VCAQRQGRIEIVQFRTLKYLKQKHVPHQLYRKTQKNHGCVKRQNLQSRLLHGDDKDKSLFGCHKKYIVNSVVESGVFLKLISRSFELDKIRVKTFTIPILVHYLDLNSQHV